MSDFFDYEESNQAEPTDVPSDEVRREWDQAERELNGVDEEPDELDDAEDIDGDEEQTDPRLARMNAIFSENDELPETPEGYKDNLDSMPEEIREVWDAGFADEAKQIACDLGLTSRQYECLTLWYSQHVLKLMELQRESEAANSRCFFNSYDKPGRKPSGRSFFDYDERDIVPMGS